MESLSIEDACGILSVVGNRVEVLFNTSGNINNDNRSYISHIIPDNIIIYGLSNGLEDTVELLEYLRDYLRPRQNWSIHNCVATENTYTFHLSITFNNHRDIESFVVGFQRARGLQVLYTRDSRRWTDYIDFEDNPFRGNYMSSFEFHISQKYSNNAVNDFSILNYLCRLRGGRRLTRRRRPPPRRIASSRSSNKR